MSTDTQVVARRALDDIDFAQAVVDGTEDYPLVLEAILADLAEYIEVNGFLNPQPLPPMPPPPLIEAFGSQWGVANPNLIVLAGQGQEANSTLLNP